MGLVSQYARSFSERVLDPIVVMPPPERFILKLWHGVVDSGIPWANVYLHTGEGAEDRNAQLLMQVAAVMKTISTPFVTSADWNMSPKDLQNTDFLTLIGGVTVAPDRHAYESAGAQSLIDYFVVHPLLAAAVKCEVWEPPLIP